MSGAAELIQKAGPKISESVGGGGVQQMVADAPAKTAPTAGGSVVGRTRDRDGGEIDIGMLVPDPDQPRKEFDDEAIDRLATSLKRFGQLQNIRVRESEDGLRWVIISGERRYRAALKAGLKKLKCEFVTKELTDAQRLEQALVENCVRQDLNGIELAESYLRLMELRNYNARTLAEWIGVTSGSVSKVLSLLRLPPDLQQRVAAGTLPRGVAYEISRLPDEAGQRAMADKAEAEGLSTADIAGEVQSTKGRRNHRATKTGRRLTCTLMGGSVAIACNGELTLDGLLALLSEVSRAAKKAKAQGRGIDAVPVLLKERGMAPTTVPLAHDGARG